MNSIESQRRELRDFIVLGILAVCIAVIMLLVTSCNKQIIDLQYSYNYAYIELPNGETVSGRIDSWTDYADGDQLQVTINGNVYLVHSSDCVLVYYKSM